MIYQTSRCCVLDSIHSYAFASCVDLRSVHREYQQSTGVMPDSVTSCCGKRSDSAHLTMNVDITAISVEALYPHTLSQPPKRVLYEWGMTGPCQQWGVEVQIKQ